MLILLYELNGTQGRTKVNLPNKCEEANENKSRNLEIHLSLYRVSKGKEEETQLCVFTDVMATTNYMANIKLKGSSMRRKFVPSKKFFFSHKNAWVEKKLL